MIKLAYVIHSCNNSGGMERILAIKTNYLSKHGFEISIIVLNGLDRPFFFDFDTNIKFYSLDIPSNKLKYKDQFITSLTQCLNSINPDITISTGVGLIDYVFQAKDASKKILEIHFSKYRRKFILANLDRYWLGRVICDIYSSRKTNIANKYDRFVVLTDEDRDHWRYLSNINVINNPVTLQTSNYSDNTNKKIIAVGRFTYQKGFDKLIEIWSVIHNKYPNWTLSIFGDGHKKDKIIKQAKKNNILESIEFNKPSKRIELEFANNSIMVMTSRYEGMPLVLLEAMSCGLPVVAYACKCGPRDIINDCIDGFLIDFNDKYQFIEKLSLLIENTELRHTMGQNALKNVDRFNLDKIMTKWIKLFNDVLSS